MARLISLIEVHSALLHDLLSVILKMRVILHDTHITPSSVARIILGAIQR